VNQRPRKRFGQNFLVDATVIEHIVECIQPRAGERIVEIGPGRGALTRRLVESGAEIHAVEIDRDLSAVLAERFGHPGNLTVHSCDALQANLAHLCGGGDWRLAGNLPYNISTPILFHFLEQDPLPRDIHVMLQREVVQRIVAEPGGRDYGRLSVMVQNRCGVEPLFEIGPQSFDPPPRVQSMLLRLKPRTEPLARAPAEALDRVVRAAFAQRRKTLRNSLSGLFDEQHLRATGIDPGLRPEQLSLEQFDRLALALPAT